MGQTLSSPATQKFSESGGNERFLYAVSEMQGWRITMEDAHAVILSLDEEGDESTTFFAVYDGHGGGSVAKFAAQNVHKRLVNEETYRNKEYEAALKRAFLGTDEDILADPGHTRDPSGCTAVAALITHDGRIFVANAGDSRSVLSVKGEVKPLSFDHKPSNEGERTRISEAGGFIEFNRVNGNLALSRALGDFEFKKNYSLIPEKQVITADPDVTIHDITEEDEFFVIACDGIWDCLSSQQVVDFVRLHVSQGKELTEIGELMCDHCLAPDTSTGAGIGCDNMTVLIVALLHGRTKEEWYSWVTDRTNRGYGYETPTIVPQIYAQSRLLSFRARREAQEARERARQERDDIGSNVPGLSSMSGQFARVLGSTGGISYHPGSRIMTDSGTLMFANDESDDDDSGDDDEINSGRPYFADTLGPGVSHGVSSLKSCLEDLAQDMRLVHDNDGDVHMDLDDPDSWHTGSPRDSIGATNGKVPAPLNLLPNGDTKITMEQLKPQLEGDEPSPAVKAEGFLDYSENPFKV